MVAICQIKKQAETNRYRLKCSIYSSSGKLSREVEADNLKTVALDGIQASIAEVSSGGAILVVYGGDIDVYVEGGYARIRSIKHS